MLIIYIGILLNLFKCCIENSENEGNLIITRWNINKHTAKCEKFTFKGYGTDFNNFSTEQDCLNQLNLTLEKQSSFCLLKKDVGRCKASFSRWYYDNSEKKCILFKYGGCEGNGNNFESEQDCLNACYVRFSEKFSKFDCQVRPRISTNTSHWGIIADVKNNRCVLAAIKNKNENNFGIFPTFSKCLEHSENKRIKACSVDPYQGNAEKKSGYKKMLTRFYYDLKLKKCREMISYEIPFDSDKNNFFSLNLCKSYCIEENYTDNYYSKSNICDLPLEKGTGILNVNKWYYENGTCKSFIYKGINGNENNFSSVSECKLVCDSKF